MIMKKLIPLSLLLFCSMLYAQKGDNREINTEFAEKINHIFEPLEKERVPHGLLLDYAFEFTDLAAYNGNVTDTNAVHLGIYKEIYNTLLMAQVKSNKEYMYNPEEFKSRWNNLRQLNNQAVTLTPHIVLSGLYYKYAKIAATAIAEKKIKIENDQIHDVYHKGNWLNPYEVIPTFAVSAPVMKVEGLTANISLPESLFYTNQKSMVQSISANFDDGTGYQNISYDTPIQVKYDKQGMYTWRFRLHLTNGEVLEAHTKMIFKAKYEMEEQQDKYKTEQITATKGYLGVNGKASLQIIDRNGDGLQNPLIIAEGFDPAIFEPESVYGINNLGNFLTSLNETNNLRNTLNLYDIIYVNWDDSFAPIQRNAYVLEEVINYVNQKKTGNNQNVVLGQSMGGLAARYALKDMENDPDQDHDTWLYASHDAPHQGANIPLGFQYLDRHVYKQFVQSPLLEDLIVGIADGAAILYDVQTMFDAYSAKQMLKKYVNNDYEVDNQVHEAWQNELNQIGYPQQTRNIALSNGNNCASPQPFNPGDELFKVKGSVRTGWFSDLLLTVFPLANNILWTSTATITYEPGFLLGILPGGNRIKAEFWAKALPQSGSEQIYRGFISYTKKVLWAIPITVHITNKNFNSPSNTLPFDYYTGGKYETPVSIDNESYQNAFFRYNIEGNMQESFCFVPTLSALDLGEGDVTLTDNDYQTIYAATAPPAAPKNIPFDNFTTSYNDSFINEVHISFNPYNGDWLADELENDPEVFDCSYLCESNHYRISGPRVLCNNSSYTVSNSQNLRVSWSLLKGTSRVNVTSSGNSVQLNPISGKNGYVTLAAELTSEYCSVQESVLLTKRVWIGKPRVIITSSYTDNTNALSFTILLDDMQEQGVTQVVWTQTGGNGSLMPLGNTASVGGPASGWQVQGVVRATNNCGTTEQSFYVGGGDGFEFNDGNTALMMVNNDVYKVFDKQQHSYDIPDLQNIEVTDVYGSPVMSTQDNHIDLSGESSGIYIIRATIDNQYMTTKIAR